MSPSTLPAGNWQLDPAGTDLTIETKNFMVKTVGLSLDVTDGSITIDDSGNVEIVNISVDAASVDSQNAKRDDHLRTDDFLDVANHPVITLTSSEVQPAGEGQRLSGTITVRETKAPLTLDVTDIAVSGTSATFRAHGSINRNDIGLGKMPTFMIGRELAISISGRATQN